MVDYFLLGFYRKLCDHHTSFLKVLNNAVILIALYAFCYLYNSNFEQKQINKYFSDQTTMHIKIGL